MGTYRIQEKATGKVIKEIVTFDSSDPEKLCPRPRDKYEIRLITDSSQVRESGSGTQTVNLRESRQEDPAEHWSQTLRRLSEALNPGTLDSFHTAFVKGRD